jgi:hypothetical protein
VGDEWSRVKSVGRNGGRVVIGRLSDSLLPMGRAIVMNLWSCRSKTEYGVETNCLIS